METQVPAAGCAEIRANAARLFEVGMMYATGCMRPFDLVSAHICFKLACKQGHESATRLRQEIAAEMSKEQIAAAQRAARDCFCTSSHDVLPAPVETYRPQSAIQRSRRQAAPSGRGSGGWSVAMIDGHYSGLDCFALVDKVCAPERMMTEIGIP